MKKELNIQWDHSHNYGVDDDHSKNKVKAVFWLTTIVMILEIVAGMWSGSMALLADGWHMGTHSAALLIALFVYSYSKKHAKNQSFSFGTGKVNYLGGFASAVGLAIVALMMIVESVQRLIEPQNIFFNEAIAVAILGLIVNVASVFLLHDDHHHNHEQHHHHHHDDGHHHDHNMKAAYFHVLADTLTSVLAIVALCFGKYWGLVWMDPIMGIVGAIVITRWAYNLIQESSEVLLDKSVDTHVLSHIADEITDNHNTTIHDLHVWKLASSHQAAIISISSATPLSIEEYKDILKQHLPLLSHISVEILSSRT